VARHESRREDLLREATALVERIEIQLPENEEPIVVGFRRDGAASFFFGADPVFQFNARLELRRAFVNGRLLKAERGRLIALQRERTPEQVLLLSSELAPEDAADVLQACNQRLAALRGALVTGSAQVLRCHPTHADVLARVLHWLTKLPNSVAIAQRPHAS
jgi:hypothetical protein